MIPLLIILSVGLSALLLRTRIIPDGSRLLEDLFPLWKIEQDCIIAKNGDITVAYQLTLPEIFSLSNDEYNALHLIFPLLSRKRSSITPIAKSCWT